MSGEDIIEIDSDPVFALGEKVRAIKHIRNDGTFPGRIIGERIVDKGDLGFVTGIGAYLQQFYVYSVDFYEKGCVVGMMAKELESLDRGRQA